MRDRHGALDWRSGLGAGLIATGILVGVVAVAADRLGFGSGGGFGVRQAGLLGAGVALAALGVALGGWARFAGMIVVSWRRFSAQSIPFMDVLGLAVLGGASAGLIELVIDTQRQRLTGAPLVLGVDAIWMVPVADALLPLVGALAIALIFTALRRRIPLLPAVTTVTVIAVLEVLASFPPADRVQPLAKLILCAGIGLMAARGLEARIVRRPGTIRWALGAVLVFVALLAAGVRVRHMMRERSAAADLPGSAGGPNIMLIILDTVRAANLGLYGYARPTSPFLDSLARSSVVFDSAFSTSPWTLPSHASMFTGRYPAELSANWQTPLDGSYPTVAELLSAAGYSTAGFVANRYYTSAVYGLGRGFVHYDDFDISLGETLKSSFFVSRLLNKDGALRRMTGNRQLLSRKSAADINRAALRWLSRPATRPRFVFLNYFDAHDPYWPPAPFDTLFGPVKKRENPTLEWGRPWTDEQVHAENDAYDRVLVWLDRSLEQLFAGLDHDGLLDNTIVIITSDHGEHLGEHGFMRHGRTLYQPLIHVPLLIHAPGRMPGGTRIDSPVSLRDMAATILDFAGVAPQGVPGTTLRRFADDPTAPVPSWIRAEVRRSIRTPARYPATHGDLQTFLSGGYQYIVSTTGKDELYSLSADPSQTTNLIGDPSLDAVIGRFRAAVTLDLADTAVASGRAP